MLEDGEKTRPSGSLQRLTVPPAVPTSLYLPRVGTREDGTRGEAALRRLRDFYKNLSDVSLKAGAWIWKPDRSGEGDFEYATSGAKYRLKVTLDPRLGFASGLEAAYDGETYQILSLDDSRLSLWREDPGLIPSPLPNPLFLPVAFLGAQDDACSPCDLSVSAVLDEKRWAARVGAARGIPAKAGTLELLLPGGTLQGEPYYFRVIVFPKRNLVQRIELIRQGGQILSSLDLESYQRSRGASQPFPHHIVLTGWNEKSQRTASIHYMITDLQVNPPPSLDPARFTISQDLANIVIDESRRSFLKHPNLKKE